jgi:hypothetical protein
VTSKGAILFFGLMLAACDGEAPDSPSKTEIPNWQDPAPIDATGPTFEDEDFVLSALAPRICETKEPLAPKDGLMRVSVPLRLRAKTGRPVPVGALAFFLEDAQGHQFRATLAGCAPSLRQEVLRKDQTAEGEVAFDVPKSVGKLELVYEPFLMGRKAVRARVEVPSVATEPK